MAALIVAKKQRRYTGKLASPIRRKAPLTFSGAVTEERVAQFWENHNRNEEEADAKVQDILQKKLQLLMKEYGVAEGDWQELALALASKHVPGFAIITDGGKKSGRNRVWDGPRLEALHAAVRKVKQAHQLNDRQALTFIVNNEEYATDWAPPKSHKGSKQQWAETLESRLNDAKRYVEFIGLLPATLANIAASISKNSGN